MPEEEEQPRADGEFVQMCASTVRHQRVVDVTCLEETTHGVEVTGDALQWRIAYYRKEAELKRADPGWRQLTAKDLAEWMDSSDWQAVLESAVSRLLNPQCKPPCIPVTKTHGMRLLSYGSDVYAESHPASAEEKAMLEELLKEKGERLGPSDHPVAFVVGILHHFYYLVDATVDCLPISSA
ncbi:MAG: hypothetical protein IPP14_00925 [Planctomycetes bacterium]|nr:hypothetical protein [Planctomycetota bacterium]